MSKIVISPESLVYSQKLKEKSFNFKSLNNSVVQLHGKLILHEKYGFEIVTGNPDAIKIQ